MRRELVSLKGHQFPQIQGPRCGPVPKGSPKNTVSEARTAQSPAVLAGGGGVGWGGVGGEADVVVGATRVLREQARTPTGPQWQRVSG